MRIISYEKISLQDYPEKVAAICFIGGCPLRCPYCHNPSLVFLNLEAADEDKMENEFKDYLKKRKTLLDGVVISGGEPLMHEGLSGFLKKIKVLGLSVKLDTNGVYPKHLESLLKKGLVDYVALDYKGYGESFERAVGIKKKSLAKNLYHSWKESLKIIIESGVQYELRTTVIKEIHSKEQLIFMGEELTKLIPEEKPSWFLQTYENSSMVLNKITFTEDSLSAYNGQEMLEIKEILQELFLGVCLR